MPNEEFFHFTSRNQKSPCFCRNYKLAIHWKSYYNYQPTHVVQLVFNNHFFVWFCKINALNPHLHKMGPQGPKHYIFGDHFYSKNARKLKFHVFLHFNSRKHMISSFYLKWTEFNCEFGPF